jgi:hypothetical protein
MTSRPTSLDDQSINILWKKTDYNQLIVNCTYPGVISINTATHNGYSTETFRVEPGKK